MTSEISDVQLFIPGPVNTKDEVRKELLIDRSPWDAEFIEISERLRARLVWLVHGTNHVCVPLPGSGGAGVEAMIGSFLPRDGKLLALSNGSYGDMFGYYAKLLGRDYTVLQFDEGQAVTADAVDRALREDPAITHVAVVHSETSTGVENPIEEIGKIVEAHDKGYLIDAVSSFGGVDIDARKIKFDALASNGTKCLEGIPGICFVIAEREALEKTRGNSPVRYFDLADHLDHFEETGRWPMTPPSHLVAALDKALDMLEKEGGVPARQARYAKNNQTIVEEMENIGFQALADRKVQSPIITAFLWPDHPSFTQKAFYDGLLKRGLSITPYMTTENHKTFRVASMGAHTPEEMVAFARVAREVLIEMGVEITGADNAIAAE